MKRELKEKYVPLGRGSIVSNRTTPYEEGTERK